MSFWYLQFSQKTNKKIKLYCHITSRLVFLLEGLKTSKFPFKINWPLAGRSKKAPTMLIFTIFLWKAHRFKWKMLKTLLLSFGIKKTILFSIFRWLPSWFKHWKNLFPSRVLIRIESLPSSFEFKQDQIETFGRFKQYQSQKYNST